MVAELSSHIEILATVTFVLGAFFGSYLKRKGENLATKEDFDVLLLQLKRTTQETELIKMEISRNGWLNQQQWTLRERYYAGLLEGLYGLKSALKSMQTWYLEPDSEHRDADIGKSEAFQNLQNAAYIAFKRLKELHGPAEVVISERATKALEVFYSDYWSDSEFSSCNSEYLDRAFASLAKAHETVLSEAKNQLVPSLA